MSHEILKLQQGADFNKTPVLNTAAVSVCNLVRQMFDRSGLGLWQKLGGWLRFYPTAMPSTVRALHAWADLRKNKWLAVGCQDDGVNGSALITITDGNLSNITPQVREDDVAVSVDTTVGSNIVNVDDTGSNATAFDAVFVPAHISVGGLIVFGMYPVMPVSANTFQLAILDRSGNPFLATAAVINGGVVAAFTTTVASAEVNVNLPLHGYIVGDTYSVLIETTVDVIVLSGDYIVLDVVDANNFTILSSTLAVAVATVSINTGKARYDFYLGSGPLPAGSGYGAGGYGTGGYGSGAVPVAPTGDPIATLDWTFDNFGELLIAVPNSIKFGSPDGVTRQGGPIMYWSPTTQTASPLTIGTAPPVNDGAFVAMPQQQIIAWGSTATGFQDPLLLRWCDVGRIGVWIGNPTNRAGQRRLSTGSRIVSGLQLGQQALVLTDVGAWTMQYTGGQGVYSINEVAKGCGLRGRKAVGTLGSTAYWMGQSQFFVMGDSGVEPMPCPIWDIIFQNLFPGKDDEIRFAANSMFNEAAWFYPSASGTGAIDSYIKCNVMMPPGAGWDYGRLGRTSWINQSVLGPPIGADTTSNLLYQHETSNDADGQAMLPSFRTGFFVLQEGDELMFVDQVWPDMKWGQGTSTNATVLLTFHVAEYPADDLAGTAVTYGPFTLTYATKFVTPRFRGRLVSIEVSSADTGSFWRIGGTRYRVQPDGKFL